MTIQKRKTSAKKTSEKRAEKINVAKTNNFDTIDCRGQFSPCEKCFDCKFSTVCFDTKTADIAAANLQAGKQATTRTVTKVKIKNKVGLIELFASILLHEKRLTLAELLQKSMVAGAGNYDNMPVVGASQFRTHLTHLANNKSKPVLVAGYKVIETNDGLALSHNFNYVHNAPMFGAW